MLNSLHQTVEQLRRLQHARLTRRSALLGLSAAGVAGIAHHARAAASPGTYDLFANTSSYAPDGNYSDGPELITYAASGVRGGLWVHSPTGKSVENGSYTDPFHRGDWGHNVRRVRVKSRKSFKQPLSLVVKGKTMWYDPLGGQTIGGIRRSTNGGLKILIGHYSNDYNYGVTLIRETGTIQIFREFNHVYTTLVSVSYATPIDTIRTFKITWINNVISVYRRLASDPWDNSNDVLITSASAPGTVSGVQYDDKPIGMYLDGAAVRMYDCHIWQG